LIVDHEIVSLPSASTIAVLRRELAGRKAAQKVFAALADPVFSDTDADERLKEAARAAQGGASAQSKTSPVVPSLQDRVIRELLGAGDSGSRMRLTRLRASGEEAATIAKFTPPGMSKVALGFEANHATATSPELGEYRHVLFGGARGSGETTAAGVSGPISDTGFALALGGGLDVNAGKHVAFRIGQVDYLLTKTFGGSQHNVRYSAGLVFRFGSK